MNEYDFKPMHLILEFGFPSQVHIHVLLKKKPLLCTKNNMKTLLIICLLVSVFNFSEACSCAGGHPQRQFCDADFGRYLIVFWFTVAQHTNKILDGSI